MCAVIHPIQSCEQGASAGEMKRRVFQIPCDMQRSLDLLSPDYATEKNNRERGQIFGSATTKWRQGA